MPRRPSSASRFDDTERAAWSGFLAVHSRVIRELDVQLAGSHGLPLTEFEVLLKLELGDGRMRMSELAEAAFLSRSGLTRVVDELAAQGLVRRETDEQDGRVLYATVTHEGRRRFAAARRAHVANVRRVFLGPLSPEQQAVLAESFTLIAAALPETRTRAGRPRASPARGRSDPPV